MSCENVSFGFANDGCQDNNVQDKVCIVGARTLVAATAEQIYFSNIAVSATGYLKILSTPTAATTITLTFLLNNTTVTIPALIDPLTAGEAVAFTVVKFDEISITSSTAGTVTFELSLTPRYLA